MHQTYNNINPYQYYASQHVTRIYHTFHYCVFFSSLPPFQCGFFKRKKRDQLKNLIKSTESEREILHSDSFSACSNDVMVLPSGHNGFFASSIHDSRNDEEFFFNQGNPASAILHASSSGLMYDEDLIHERNFYPYNHSNPMTFRSYTLRSSPSLPNGSSRSPFSQSFSSLPRPVPPLRGRGHRSFMLSRESPIPSPRLEPFRGYNNNNNNDNDELWVPLGKRPPSPPAFNNEMYLEPVFNDTSYLEPVELRA